MLNKLIIMDCTIELISRRKPETIAILQAMPVLKRNDELKYVMLSC